LAESATGMCLFIHHLLSWNMWSCIPFWQWLWWCKRHIWETNAWQVPIWWEWSNHPGGNLFSFIKLFYMKSERINFASVMLYLVMIYLVIAKILNNFIPLIISW